MASSSVLSLVVDTSRMLPRLKQASAALDAFGGKALKVGAALLSISAPAGLFAKKAVSSLIDFDAAMTNSLSIMSGVSNKMRSDMGALAEQMSTSLPISATEAAKGYEYLALAGLSADQSLAALPVVAKLATAGNFSMSQSSDQLTDALSALGLASKDASGYMANMTMLADKLTKGASSANASILQFSTALTNDAALAMRTFGVDINDGIAVLGVYADQGIKGLEAGSLFSRGIRMISKASRNSADEWKRLGFNAFDAEGNLKSFSDIARQLEKILGGMSPEMKSATLETLGFEARIQQAIFPIIGMSDRLTELRGKLEGASGTLEEITNKQLKSISNQFKVARNTIEQFARSLAAQFEPQIRWMIDSLRMVFDRFSALSPAIKKIIGGVIVFAAALAPVVLGSGAVAFAVSALIPVIAAITPEILAVAAAAGIVAAAIADNFEWISAAVSNAYDIISPSFDGMGESMSILGQFAQDYLSPILGGILVIAIGSLTNAVMGIKLAFNIVSVGVKSAALIIVSAIELITKPLVLLAKQFDSTKDFAEQVEAGFKGFRSEIWKDIKEDVSDVGDAFIGVGKNVISTAAIISGDFKKSTQLAAKSALGASAASATGSGAAASMTASSASLMPQAATRFAGAAQLGSVEAYKAEISKAGFDDIIAKSTEDTANNTKGILDQLRQNNAGGGYELGGI